jgi:hypothetical protein
MACADLSKGVRGFLGLAGYYRKFIHDFGSIAAPLTQLLTKDGFWWTTESQEAFVKLKTALITPPILHLLNFEQPFIVECDASGTSLGAILSQNDQPIVFFSEALKGSARALSTYDKEMLAVVKVVRKWRPYLLGKPFVIKTDHQSLKYLLEQRILTPSQARWLPKLMGYDYTILYKRGRDNQGLDALSRVTLLHFQALTLPSADWWSSLQQEVIDNPYYATLSKNASSNCFRRDGVWMENGKVHLSPNSSLLPAVLADAHSLPAGGHFGYLETINRVSSSFIWPGLHTAVKEFIRNCMVCQRCKYDTLRPAGLLHSLAIPDHIWTDLSMDFIDGLSSS